jgi:hypothetical protein
MKTWNIILSSEDAPAVNEIPSASGETSNYYDHPLQQQVASSQELFVGEIPQPLRKTHLFGMKTFSCKQAHRWSFPLFCAPAL